MQFDSSSGVFVRTEGLSQSSADCCGISANLEVLISLRNGAYPEMRLFKAEDNRGFWGCAKTVGMLDVRSDRQPAVTTELKPFALADDARLIALSRSVCDTGFAHLTGRGDLIRSLPPRDFRELAKEESVMNDLFCPAEHAILCDWLGLPRPDGSDLDLWELPPELEALLGPDDPEEVAQVRLRPVPFASEETARANGVARLVLNAIQDRLPQWGAANDGQVQLSRGYETRTDRPVEPLPQHLLTINWADSGPGFSWPEAYYATALPGYDRVVVTASQDSPDAYGYTDLAIGWFDAATPLVEGAKQVITQWWREVRQSYDEGAAWAYLFDEGLVSADEANAWREETWPGSEPIQDYEEDEEDEDD